MNKIADLKPHLDNSGVRSVKPPKLSMSKKRIIEELGKIVDKANKIRIEHDDEFRALGI